MQPDPARCSECGGEMEVGFMTDVTEAGFLQQKWARGFPVAGWFAGLKVKKEDSLLVETHRCKSCGYLKSYAK